VRRWINDATVRLASSPKQADSNEAEADGEVDKEKMIESLREELRVSNEALVEERKENTNLSDQCSTLNRELEAARKEKQTLEGRLAARPALAATRRPSRPGRPVPVSWLLCIALGILVMALILGQRSARTREKALLASIQGTVSGSVEDIHKEDIMGRYYWVENDRSAGTLSFTEKDGDIYACAIDGTTGLRSRGRGTLVGNVLTAELRSGTQEGVVTKFIFANRGRTLTAVWQGEEGTSVAAGTKAIKE
jgi:hypothetical protein